MQMSEASRQIIYGTVVVAMLFVYGRADKIASCKEKTLTNVLPTASGTARRARRLLVGQSRWRFSARAHKERADLLGARARAA